MKMMEVRCCCKPQKLLGYLPVEENARAYVGVIFDKTQFDPLRSASYNDPLRSASYKTIRLPVEIVNQNGNQHYALKSEETPIEVLRQLPGFLEK